MSPTPRAAAGLALVAVGALVLPVALAALAALALVVAVALDARAVRRAPEVSRELPAVLSRGVPVPFAAEARAPAAARVRLRQAVPLALALDRAEEEGRLSGTLVGRRRGRHALPALGTRSEGPLRLASWHHRPGDEQEVRVFPDLATARRLVLAVRRGRFRDEGVSARGPLGLGTDFESVRDYQPDDDVRQVNWRATARMGRPMSNQYRVDQDRDVVCVVDAGRLAAAPLPGLGAPDGRTVLDVCLDAVTAVALVADEVGDRCGAVAFDAEVRAHVRPRRAGGEAVVRRLFDLEPRRVDADYELALRQVEGAKRGFVLILCDLLEEAAARSLVEAVPVLARRHAVAVASPADPELAAANARPPRGPWDVYRTAAVLDVLDARARAAALVRRAGAEVVEAAPERLPVACVRAYLRAKARARV